MGVVVNRFIPKAPSNINLGGISNSLWPENN